MSDLLTGWSPLTIGIAVGAIIGVGLFIAWKMGWLKGGSKAPKPVTREEDDFRKRWDELKDNDRTVADDMGINWEYDSLWKGKDARGVIKWIKAEKQGADKEIFFVFGITPPWFRIGQLIIPKFYAHNEIKRYNAKDLHFYHLSKKVVLGAGVPIDGFSFYNFTDADRQRQIAYVIEDQMAKNLEKAGDVSFGGFQRFSTVYPEQATQVVVKETELQKEKEARARKISS